MILVCDIFEVQPAIVLPSKALSIKKKINLKKSNQFKKKKKNCMDQGMYDFLFKK